MTTCRNCGDQTAIEDDYGEFICKGCEQNADEAAYERFCENYYGGGGPLPLIEQQRQALKFK